MSQNHKLKKSVTINAPVSKVWDALTNRELIKQYFFDTDCITDWKKGSPIVYRGVWEDKPYEDKGNILDIEKEKFIRYNYWSNFSGTEDTPANYANISYELSTDNGATIFTVIQGGIKSEEALEHSGKNWGMVMDGLKKILEK